MSDTFKHKNIGKYRRGIEDYEKVELCYPRNAKESKIHGFYVHTLDNKRRRTAERKVRNDVLKLDFSKAECGEDCHICDNKQFDEFYDAGLFLDKKFSDRRSIH